MQRNATVASLVTLVLINLCVLCTGWVTITATRSAAETRPEKAVTVARRKMKATAPSRKPSAKATPAAKPAASPAQQALTAAVGPLARDDGGQVAVAVDDLTTGADAAYSGTQEFVTASIVKVDILSTLLYQAQQSGQQLTPETEALATTMIENSDDDAASDLYDDAGGAAGIDAANQVFGLSETTVGTAGYWGLTSTTVDDQIRLLRLVFTRPSVLTTQSQDYIQDLMSQVEADQQWGVPAAADDGTPFMVKNGWLPSGSTGLWEINSIGEVVHDGQRMLIAVLSEGNATEYSGISLVQTVAGAAAAAMATSQG
jgi:Beta-lactamase enzyme family